VKADEGVKVGGSFGAGIHIFITDWVSLNLEVQDIVLRNNPAGLNSTLTEAIPKIDRKDGKVNHHATLNLGASFYVPFRAKRSR
jgi:hypothetical protein